MPKFERYSTDDGSVTFFSAEFGQSFHSKHGAIEESIDKFVVPTLLEQKAARGYLRLLDVCYGLGYNTAAALSTIWKSNPDCIVEIIALELDETVAVNAIEQQIFEDWVAPIPALLDELARNQAIDNDQLTAKLLFGDARLTIDRVLAQNFQADAIFLDPFSPQVCPQLWTIEFIDKLAHCCAKDGRIATYSCAVAVRVAMIAAGLEVADTISDKRKKPGSIAGFSLGELPPFSQQESEHFQTRAAIPYRDPSCCDLIDKIIRRRELEQVDCGLETTSQWKKRWRR